MARVKPDDLQKEVEAQDDEVYGEDYASAPNPDKIASRDTEETLRAVIGNTPEVDEDGFSIADEVDEDESAIRHKPVNDYKSDSSDNSDDDDDKDSDDEESSDYEPRTQDPFERLSDE